MGDLENVNVALRIRPLVQSEVNRGCQVAVERVANLNQVLVNNSEPFTFNYVFDVTNTQKEIYDITVSPMVDKFIGGFNATILAYGQTGSGKTHTMGTSFNGTLDDDNVGVIPRAMHDLFERLKNMNENYEFVVKCSFTELYQEQLFDLLTEKNREESVVDIREDRNGIIMVGLTEQLVQTAKETTDCLLKGSSERAVGATAMNQQSSRSHAIFTITLQSTKRDESRATTTSKFHLVDLAGSERSKKTQATGDRFKEGVKINQGLLALGNVISALGDGKGTGFVRYRDSKLTRLLQDSLGGNSVTLMIACVSPADYNVAETLSTLRYADRARKIKNKPIINQDPHAAEINRLKGIIRKLRLELLSNGGVLSSSMNSEMEKIEPMSQLKTLTSSMPALTHNNNDNNKQNQILKELQQKYRNLQLQCQETLHDLTENEMRAHIAEKAHENLKTKSTELINIIAKMKECLPEEVSEELQDKVKQINELALNMNEEMERTTMEILDNKKCFPASSAMSNGLDDGDDGENVSPEMNAVLQEHTEAFTTKQMEINEQLRRINRELTLKEQLQQRMAGNFNRYSTMDDNIEERFRECEEKIHELEAEKVELLEKLRHVKENASAKIAEERRKRLQVLEQEITEMKNKNLQQSKLLKIREKETLKIKNLNQEIQSMKEAKVKLIRSMRQEAEKFRQFRLIREKELVQLRNKDRKLQNEMARKEALHNKQRNVLKRKCEEAMAINKRLKDALDRQKVAQVQRQQTQTAKGTAQTKIDQLIGDVRREVDVILSLIDAEHTLEQLMDDRSVITSRINDLEQQCPTENSPDEYKLNSLREELEMRNAQISDLQQKVYANDIDRLITNVSDIGISLMEARAIVKYLLKTTSELRREHTKMQTQISDELNALKEKQEESIKKIRVMKLLHEEQIAEYEEKISVALTPEQEAHMKLLEEYEQKIKSLENELREYKQMFSNTKNRNTNAKQQVHCTVRKVKAEATVVQLSSLSDSEFSDFEDRSKDPDWHKTPVVRRHRSKWNKPNNIRQSTKRSSNYAKGDSSSDITTATITIHRDENTNDEEQQKSQQRLSDVETASRSIRSVADQTKKHKSQRKSSGCKCRGDCRNQRCGCNSVNQKCSLTCQCTSTCKNRDTNKFEETDNDNGDSEIGKVQSNRSYSTSITSDDENTTNNNDIFVKTFATNSSNYLTPKMARISTLNFERSASRKKFFQ